MRFCGFLLNVTYRAILCRLNNCYSCCLIVHSWLAELCPNALWQYCSLTWHPVLNGLIVDILPREEILSDIVQNISLA